MEFQSAGWLFAAGIGAHVVSCNIRPGLVGTGLGEGCGLFLSLVSIVTEACFQSATAGKWSFICGFAHGCSGQSYFVKRIAYSNNSCGFMIWKHRKVLVTQIKKNPTLPLTACCSKCRSGFLLFPGASLFWESCRNTAIACQWVYPSSCPELGSRVVLSTRCIAQQPRECFSALHSYTSFHWLHLSLRDWNPGVRKSFPCSPSCLVITNLRLEKKNAMSIQMHP